MLPLGRRCGSTSCHLRVHRVGLGRHHLLPSVESPDVKSKAGAANKSPQQYLDDEKAMVQKYHDQGRDDLAEQEAQSRVREALARDHRWTSGCWSTVGWSITTWLG